MKREDILDSLEFIDEEFIEEAEQGRSGESEDGASVSDREEPVSGQEELVSDAEKIVSIRRRNALARRWGTLAAGFAVLIVAAFLLTGILRTRSMNMSSMKSAEVGMAENSSAEETEAAVQEMAAETAGQLGQTATAEPRDSAESSAAAVSPESVETYDAAAEEYTAGDMAEPQAEESLAENAAEAAAEEGLAEDAAEVPAVQEAAGAAEQPEETEKMAAAANEETRIRVTSDAGEIVFVLNDTPAAQSLLAQLPLTAETEPYSSNEIVFQPETPLDTENGLEGGGTAGYLGYFAPWNNVVMYYGDFEEYPGLYILGEAVSGAENIKDIKGMITIEPAGE